MVLSSAHDWMEMSFPLLSSSSPAETHQRLIRSDECSHHTHTNQALPNILHEKGIAFSLPRIEYYDPTCL